MTIRTTKILDQAEPSQPRYAFIVVFDDYICSVMEWMRDKGIIAIPIYDLKVKSSRICFQTVKQDSKALTHLKEIGLI